jgi:predicted DNA-binding mobile mystery protein A
MSVKDTATRHYLAIVDAAAARTGEKTLSTPPEGWIVTVRKALGMSGAQLAKRLGVTRARVSQAERAETDGGVTLKTMQTIAEAMGCRFVYAIVPDGRIRDVIAAQARKRAKALVAKASDHMALESQSLSDARNAEEVERIARDLIHTMPPDFWTDK